MKLKELFKKYGILFILFLLILISTICTRGLFLSPSNLVNVTRQISMDSIIAFGMTFIIITGGIDLSVGSIVALSGVLGALVLKLNFQPLWLTILFSMLVGITIGLSCGSFSALMITRFNIPPFISTLAVMTMGRGLAMLACNGLPVFQLPSEFKIIGRGYILENVIGPYLPVPVIIMIIFFVVFHILLTKMTIGRALLAVGGNEEASRLSGINVKKVKFFAYALTGAVCGLAGIILTSRLMSGDPKSATGWELNVIAAVVVGGTSLSGGRGTITGTLIGAFIIGILNNVQNLLNVSAYWQMVVLGFVILCAVLLDMVSKKKAS